MENPGNLCFHYASKLPKDLASLSEIEHVAQRCIETQAKRVINELELLEDMCLSEMEYYHKMSTKDNMYGDNLPRLIHRNKEIKNMIKKLKHA